MFVANNYQTSKREIGGFAISSINDNYLERKKQEDVTKRLEKIAHDNEDIL